MVCDDVRSSLTVSGKPVALSFFTGAGGLDIGMSEAGFETVLTCEVDKHARGTIRENLPHVGRIGDLTKYSTTEILNYANLPKNVSVDVVYGGPPCQAFSTAGKRGGFTDERGNVFLKFLTLIGEISPQYVVIENVRGLLSMPVTYSKRNKDLLPQMCTHIENVTAEKEKGRCVEDGCSERKAHHLVVDFLHSYGYTTSLNLYNAANFGAPQMRDRVVFVAKKGNVAVPYLQPTHSDNPVYNLPSWVTVREAFSAIPETVTHHYLDFPAKRLQYYKMLTAGQNWRNLPPEMQEEAVGSNVFNSSGGRTGFLRRLAWDRPSPTLVTNPIMPATSLAHPTLNRPLSVEEYATLQGFPQGWRFEGSVVEQYKQIGNAVPVKLGKAVGEVIINDMNNTHPERLKGFKYSKYTLKS